MEAFDQPAIYSGPLEPFKMTVYYLYLFISSYMGKMASQGQNSFNFDQTTFVEWFVLTKESIPVDKTSVM